MPPYRIGEPVYIDITALDLRGPDHEGEGADESVPGLGLRVARRLVPSSERLLALDGPLEWPRPLFRYQRDGVAVLLKRDALLLADDMGLGKTIQAIAALRVLTHMRTVESALVVAPAGLLGNWRGEFSRWAPELKLSTVRGSAEERAWQWAAPAHVHIVSYETLRSDFTANPVSPPRRHTWDAVILDEAQKIKNSDAEVSRKCKAIPRRRAWALTGTPLENRIEDLASILEFVAPLRAGDAPRRLAPGPALLEEHRGLQLRRKKAEVLADLPPKLVSTVSVALSGEQRRSYQRAEREGIIELRRLGGAVRIQNVLELITRLKQICNFCPASGKSAKLEDLQERLETLESEGQRALVFSQFIADDTGVGALAARLRRFRPVLYTGDMTDTEKDAALQAFRGNPDRAVMILSLRAGGQGLNLQEASYVFHFDRWWNPAVEHQAEDRSHRIGQRLPVHVYSYICTDTIEERIEAVLDRKQFLFDTLVDDVSISIRSALTADELFGLFGLAPPREPGETPIGAPDFRLLGLDELRARVASGLVRRGWRVDNGPCLADEVWAERKIRTAATQRVLIVCHAGGRPPVAAWLGRLRVAAAKHGSGTAIVLASPAGAVPEASAVLREAGITVWGSQELAVLCAVS